MTTRTIRESQQRAFERVSAFLAGLSDGDLAEVSYAVRMAAIETRERLGLESPGPGDPSRAPAEEALGRLGDILVDETNHRQGVLWNAQADLNGGHYPMVSLDATEFGKWQAYCAPVWDGGKECWEGPNRDTVEEAIADSKRHCDVEPEIYGNSSPA